MDGISQRNSLVFPRRSRFEDQRGEDCRPCDGCKTLDCHSIHGSVAQECPLRSRGCYICADLAKIDNEISRAYKRLSNLVKKRQKILKKPAHDTPIRRLPVEILSSIFVFVRDLIVDFEFEKHPECPIPAFEQPIQPPSVLVGAVCKLWRDISLATPQLWTDIIIDLAKCADGQCTMVKEWARRSGALPVDISVYRKLGTLEGTSDQYGDLLSLLRSLAARWHDIALYVPASFFYELLNNLQETPFISSCSIAIKAVDSDLTLLQMHHPFLPRHLSYRPSCDSRTILLPFGWDRLVFLEIFEADGGHVLHIIRHAQNLKHCTALCHFGLFAKFKSPKPTSIITNNSLIYLVTDFDILGHLTLPSLLHLDCVPDVEDFNSIVGFFNRCSPPLDNFILHCYVEHFHTFPPLDRLSGITSLFLEVYGPADGPNVARLENFLLALARPSPNTALPRLKEIFFGVPHMSASSWSSFSRLFRKHAQSNSADVEAISSASVPIGRSLSKGSLFVKDLHKTLERDTLLHLLEVKKSGVDLGIELWDGPVV